MPTFIESQFPVSRLSKESFKERSAANSQTLASVGRWVGRKPLILVRATILGLLMPASDDPERDRAIFLKILTMDREGLLSRFKGMTPASMVLELMTPAEVKELNDAESSWREEDDKDRKAAAREVFQETKQALTEAVFLRLPYEEQLNYCHRPEQIAGPSENAWVDINHHLGTTAFDLPTLVRELGMREFGHPPRVGDAFCGGGSIPFEAARIGCEAYASDLNPVAALLTWAALNIVGGGEEVAREVRQGQENVYDAVNKQVTAWGIEHKTEELPDGRWEAMMAHFAAGEASVTQIAEKCWRADAYLYCAEVTCPETGWQVPLAPNWVIGKECNCVAKLVPDTENRRYQIEIQSNVSDEEMSAAKLGTVRKGYLHHPILESEGYEPPSIKQIRIAGRSQDPDSAAAYHESGLRLWENDDLIPRSTDVFGERLYCVRWVESYFDKKGKLRTRKHYRTVTEHDLAREEKAVNLLHQYFKDWQKEGFLPSNKIESGFNTDQPIRERGWSHWHHLFNPRQLLSLGLLNKEITRLKDNQSELAAAVALGKCTDYNARLSRWHARKQGGIIENVLSDQALNPLFNYGARSVLSLRSTFQPNLAITQSHGGSTTQTSDARLGTESCDIWITDPPYADAVNYHELSEFSLAWYAGLLGRNQKDWQIVSRRALAVTGSGENFRRSMVDCYRNLATHMPDNGYQVVMFTHQDAGVWADLALILWSSGLRVTAAWTLSTETDSALKDGNYVKGTVLLVLRKQTGEEVAFLDEIYPEVEREVRSQLDSMHELDDTHAASPDFGDTDYQLAAYAAALRVLTQYKSIEDIDIAYELAKPRQRGADKSPIEKVIDEAVKIACDHLVPRGFDPFVWKTLSPAERFYLKGLDLETHGEFRAGAYQELARGFGLREYTPLLGNAKANEVRLKTATAFDRKLLKGGDDPFTNTLTRHVLFAIREVAKQDSGAEAGKIWLKEESPNYWGNRKTLIIILRYLARLQETLPTWQDDSAAATLLAGALENDNA